MRGFRLTFPTFVRDGFEYTTCPACGMECIVTVAATLGRHNALWENRRTGERFKVGAAPLSNGDDWRSIACEGSHLAVRS